MTEKLDKTIIKITKELFELLDFHDCEISLEEKEGIFQVQVKTQDSALLIGHHGENISALQIILGLIIYHQTGSWQKINLNVNNWRQVREEFLKKMALNLAQKAKFSGKAVEVANLSPADRRVVHLYLADHPDVTTYSEGEGKDRRLIVKLKNKV
jgi:spoIIIJ-associated protein